MDRQRLCPVPVAGEGDESLDMLRARRDKTGLLVGNVVHPQAQMIFGQNRRRPFEWRPGRQQRDEPPRPRHAHRFFHPRQRAYMNGHVVHAMFIAQAGYIAQTRRTTGSATVPQSTTSRRVFMLTTICAAGLLAAGPAHADGNEPMLTIAGELSYLPRIALPPQAVAFVRISPEGATDDTSATAETRIELDGRQVPVAFSLELPRAHIEDGTSYQLSGGILIDGQARWRTGPVAIDVSAPHFDAGTLMMSQQQEDQQPAAEPAGQEALAGEWRIVRVGQHMLGDDAGATISFDAEGAFSGRLCNSYRGSYIVEGATISLGQAAATLMACPEPQASQERALFSAFESASTYRIGEDGTLALLDNEGQTLMSAQR